MLKMESQQQTTKDNDTQASYVQTPEERNAMLKEREQRAKKIKDRKMKLVDDPNAFLLMPKTREGHLIVKLCFAFDRAVGRLRMRAGSPNLPIKKVSDHMKEIEEYLSHCDTLLGILKTVTFNVPTENVPTDMAKFKELLLQYGILPKTSDANGQFSQESGFMNETPDMRRLLAGRRESYLILPRTDEAKRMLIFIKRMDPLLLQCRMTCTDFTKSGPVIQEIHKMMSNLDTLIQKIAHTVQWNYISPKGLPGVFKSKNA